MSIRHFRKTTAGLLIVCFVLLSGTISYSQNINNSFEEDGLWNLTGVIGDSSLPPTLFSGRMKIAGSRDIYFKNAGSRLIRGRVYITDCLENAKVILRFRPGLYGSFLLHLAPTLFLWKLLDYIHNKDGKKKYRIHLATNGGWVPAEQ